jgi:hypothetical protein
MGEFLFNLLAHVFESVYGAPERKHILAAVIGTAGLVIGMLLTIYLYG